MTTFKIFIWLALEILILIVVSLVVTQKVLVAAFGI